MGSNHFSPNKEYDLYSMYMNSEKVHKTNWEVANKKEFENSDLDDARIAELQYLKKLHDAGFKAIPKNAALEESSESFFKRQNEEIKNDKLNHIPIVKEHVDKIDHTARRKETRPPKKQINIKTNNKQKHQPKIMTKEEEKTKFSLTNIVKYLRAEQSLATQGPVSLTVFEERKKICGECPHRKTHEQIPDPLGFCTKCGCGANPRARLTNKIKMPQTSCPLGKWDTSTGIYKGVFGKLRHKLTPKAKREKLDYT